VVGIPVCCEIVFEFFACQREKEFFLQGNIFSSGILDPE